ncbi:hypothetical protein RQP46_004263 [Phenoliferia psychrophenolica]
MTESRRKLEEEEPAGGPMKRVKREEDGDGWSSHPTPETTSERSAAEAVGKENQPMEVDEQGESRDLSVVPETPQSTTNDPDEDRQRIGAPFPPAVKSERDKWLVPRGLDRQESITTDNSTSRATASTCTTPIPDVKPRPVARPPSPSSSGSSRPFDKRTKSSNPLFAPSPGTTTALLTDSPDSESKPKRELSPPVSLPTISPSTEIEDEKKVKVEDIKLEVKEEGPDTRPELYAWRQNAPTPSPAPPDFIPREPGEMVAPSPSPAPEGPIYQDHLPARKALPTPMPVQPTYADDEPVHGSSDSGSEVEREVARSLTPGPSTPRRRVRFADMTDSDDSADDDGDAGMDEAADDSDYTEDDPLERQPSPLVEAEDAESDTSEQVAPVRYQSTRARKSVGAPSPAPAVDESESEDESEVASNANDADTESVIASDLGADVDQSPSLTPPPPPHKPPSRIAAHRKSMSKKTREIVVATTKTWITAGEERSSRKEKPVEAKQPADNAHSFTTFPPRFVIAAKRKATAVVAASTLHAPLHDRVQAPADPTPSTSPPPTKSTSTNSNAAADHFLQNLERELGGPPPSLGESFLANLERDVGPPPPPPVMPPPQRGFADFSREEKADMGVEEDVEPKEEMDDDDVEPPQPQPLGKQTLGEAFEYFFVRRLFLSPKAYLLPTIYRHSSFVADSKLLTENHIPHSPLPPLPRELFKPTLGSKYVTKGRYIVEPIHLINVVPGRSRESPARRALRALCDEALKGDLGQLTGYEGSSEAFSAEEFASVEKTLEELFEADLSTDAGTLKLGRKIHTYHPVWFNYVFTLARIRLASAALATPAVLAALEATFESQKAEIEEAQRVLNQEAMTVRYRHETGPNVPEALNDRPWGEIQADLSKQGSLLAQLKSGLGELLERLKKRAEGLRDGKSVWKWDEVQFVE